MTTTLQLPTSALPMQPQLHFISSLKPPRSSLTPNIPDSQSLGSPLHRLPTPILTAALYGTPAPDLALRLPYVSYLLATCSYPLLVIAAQAATPTMGEQLHTASQTSTGAHEYSSAIAAEIMAPPPPPKVTTITFAPPTMPADDSTSCSACSTSAGHQSEVDNTDIEIDPTPSTPHPDYTSDYFSATTGIKTTSSIVSLLPFLHIHGRRYRSLHSEPLTMPNDEIEKERLELTHYWFLVQSSGHLHRSPLQPLIPTREEIVRGEKEVFRILDCGCGTGSWAVEMGEMYEGAEIVGVDLSPIQSLYCPVNVSFEVDDLEMEWTWQRDWWDFVYSRAMGNSIRDVGGYVRNIFRHLKPGGYVEMWEHQQSDITSATGPLPDESPTKRVFELYAEARKAAGFVDWTDKLIKRELEAVGFVDITVKRFKQPFGDWAKDRHMKDFGRLALEILKTGLEAHVLALVVRHCNMTAEEVRQLCDEAYVEMLMGKAKVYNMSWNIVGRKPEDAGDLSSGDEEDEEMEDVDDGEQESE